MILQVILATLAVCLFITLVGCKSAVVPMPQQRDSVRVHVETKYDSIYVDRWHTIKEQGDTIWLHDSIYVEKWREHYMRDTICVTDSISYPVEVVKEVRKRNGYDRFTAAGFWLLSLLFLIVFGWRIYKKIKGWK